MSQCPCPWPCPWVQPHAEVAAVAQVQGQKGQRPLSTLSPDPEPRVSCGLPRCGRSACPGPSVASPGPVRPACSLWPRPGQRVTGASLDPLFPSAFRARWRAWSLVTHSRRPLLSTGSPSGGRRPRAAGGGVLGGARGWDPGFLSPSPRVYSLENTSQAHAEASGGSLHCAVTLHSVWRSPRAVGQQAPRIKNNGTR